MNASTDPVKNGRIQWRLMSHEDIVAVIVWADRHGKLSLLKAARAALRRREGFGR